MVDQAEALRRLVLRVAATEPRSQRAGALVVLAGTRPGVGTTTVALHLALRLHRRGWPVGLVETQAGTQRHALGSTSSDYDHPWTTTWLDVACGSRTLREAWQAGPAGMPMILMPPTDSPPLTRREAAWASLPEAHLQLRQTADQQLVIVDAGTLEQAVPLMGLADHCCLIADEDGSQAADLYALVKRASGQMGAARPWLLMNRVKNPPSALATRQRVVSACSRFLNLAVSAAGELPEDPQLVACDGEASWGQPSPARQTWEHVLTQWIQRFEELWSARPRWSPRNGR